MGTHTRKFGPDCNLESAPLSLMGKYRAVISGVLEMVLQILAGIWAAARRCAAKDWLQEWEQVQGHMRNLPSYLFSARILHRQRRAESCTQIVVRMRHFETLYPRTTMQSKDPQEPQTNKDPGMEEANKRDLSTGVGEAVAQLSLNPSTGSTIRGEPSRRSSTRLSTDK